MPATSKARVKYYESPYGTVALVPVSVQEDNRLAQKLGLDVHRRRDRGSTKKFNQFRQAVYFLDKDWNKVKTAYKERGGNPLYWLFCAFLGFLSAGLSIAWYLHILLYVFISPPPTIFLNAFLVSYSLAQDI